LAGITWQWFEADRERREAVSARNREASARTEAEARGYASRISQAYLEWSRSRIQEAERMLDTCRQETPELCQWEWRYLKRQCQTQVLTMPGHTFPVTCLAYSPCGRWLASSAGFFNGTEPAEV